MSPLYIEILIHYHCTPIKHPRHNREAIEFFLSHGLIEEIMESDEVGIYKTTEGGKMLVDQICNVPLPVKKWVPGKAEESDNG